MSTLCNPVVCSLPGSTVHVILQARILEWSPCPPPGDLPDPGIEPAISYVSCVGRCVLYHALHQPVLKSLVYLSSDLFEHEYYFLSLFFVPGALLGAGIVTVDQGDSHWP